MNGIPPDPLWTVLFGTLPLAVRLLIGVVALGLAFYVGLYVMFPKELGRRVHPAAALWACVGWSCFGAVIVFSMIMSPEWGWLGLGVGILLAGSIAAGALLHAAGQN